MMKTRLTIIIFLTFLLVFSLVVTAKAEITGLSKAGLEIFTNIADAQDIYDGTSKFAKDKYNAYFWNMLGGYENLARGNLEGKSHIVAIKDQVDRYQKVINRISNFLLAMDRGSYPEAAFEIIEGMMDHVKHPLIKAAWAAAKLTYETHLMVVDTGAQLQIEALYHTVHRDRRLFGEQVDGGMAQIPINTETVDYFFNSYVIVNSSTRSQVKDYVGVRLGQEWPEQSWGQWFRSFASTGSGVDLADAEELEELSDEWRNVARGWIRSLLEDVNKEALKWRHLSDAMRLKNEVDAFIEEFELFEKDLVEIIEHFQRHKEIKENIEEYHELLSQVQEEYDEIIKDYNNISNLSRQRMLQIMREAYALRQKIANARHDMLMIGEHTLAAAFREIRTELTTVLITTQRKLPPEPKTVKEAADEAISGDDRSTFRGSGYSSINAEPLLNQLIEIIAGENMKPVEEIFPVEEIEIIKDEITQVLEGEVFDSDLYEDLISQWREISSKYNIRMIESITSPVLIRYPLHNREVRYIINSKRKIIESGDLGSSWWSQPQGISRQLPSRDSLCEERLQKIKSIAERYASGVSRMGTFAPFTEEQIERNKIMAIVSIVAEASRNANETVEKVMAPAKGAYIQGIDYWFRGIEELVNNKKKARGEHFDIIMKTFSDILTIRGFSSEGNVKNAINSIRPNDLIENMQKTINTSPYMGLTGIEHFTSNNLRAQARQIAGGGVRESSIVSMENNINSLINSGQNIIRIWDTFEMPTREEVEKISFFFPEISWDKIVKVDQAINNLKNQVNSIQLNTRINNLYQQVRTDQQNRQRDSKMLMEMATNWEVLLKESENRGLIEREASCVTDSFRIVLPEGYAVMGLDGSWSSSRMATEGMIAAEKPYPHLLEAEGISALAAQVQSNLSFWQRSTAFQFMANHSPESYQFYSDLISLKYISSNPEISPVKAAPEGNIFQPDAAKRNLDTFAAMHTAVSVAERELPIIWESDMNEAQGLIARIEYDTPSFEENLAQIRDLLPGTFHFITYAEEQKLQEVIASGQEENIIYQGQSYFPGHARNLLRTVSRMPELIVSDEQLQQFKGFAAAEKYKEICEELREFFAYIREEWQKTVRQEEERVNLYYELERKIIRSIENIEGHIDRETYQMTKGFWNNHEEFKEEYRNLPGEDPGSNIPEKIIELGKVLEKSRRLYEQQQQREAANLQRVELFYNKFSQAYQLQDEFGVLILICDNWESADGTTLWDLEDTLARNFRVFDAIDYDISNLRIIESQGDNTYLVAYDLIIVSHIYNRNMRHEEKSSVRELIEVDAGGEGKVLETLGGSFWH